MTEPYVLDIDMKLPTYVNEPIVKQRDDTTIVVNLLDNGLPYDFTDSTTLTLTVARLDKVSVTVGGTQTNDNQITFKVPRSAVSVIGRAEATIQIYGSDGRSSSTTFFMSVQRDPSSQTVGEGEKTLIEVVLSEGPAIIADAQTATEEAEQAAIDATQATVSANTAADRAGLSATYIEGKKTLIEKAITDSGDAKTTADTVRDQFDQVIAEAGSNNPEVVQARGTYTNLNQRLDSTAQQLADTVEGSIKFKQDVANTQLRRHGHRRPMLVFIDDDGVADVYTKIKPIVDDLDFKLSCAIISSKVGTAGYMNESQLKEMYDSGNFEYLNHTHSHRNLSELTEDEIRTDVETCSNWLQHRGYTGNIVVYPYGGSNAKVRKVMRTTSRAGVTIDNGQSLVNYPTPLKTYALERVYIDHGLEKVKMKIDEAIANNGLIIVGMHVWYDTWNEALLRGVVNYAKSSGIEIVTMEEAMDVFGNVLEVGDSARHEAPETQIINCDGKSYGADIAKVVHRLSGYDGWLVTNDTPVTYFPSDTTTVSVLFADQQGGFPTNGAGTLITESYSIVTSKYWTKQKWIPSASNREFSRYWIVSSNKWSDWVSHDLIYKRKLHDQISNTTPITDFDNDTVTVTTVGSDRGFPSYVSGTVVTYSLGNGFSYQEFKAYNSENRFTRTTLPSGAWGDWAAVYRQLWGYTSINHGAIPAKSVVEIKKNIAGIALNDLITVNPHESIPQGLMYNAYVSAIDEIAVRVFNTTESPISCSFNWKYSIFKQK